MSDEIVEMYCEQCEKDLGKQDKAGGFCVNCVEYLCPTCLRYHKKHLQQHVIQDNTNMPLDFCFDKCSNHPREIIKFYCKLCADTACPKCKHEKHGDCSEVCHIPTLFQSDSINMSDQLKQINISIKETLEELAAKQERVDSNQEAVRSNEKNDNAAILEHKATLINQVKNQHEQDLDDLDLNQSNEIKRYEQKKAEIIKKLDDEIKELLETHNAEKRTLSRQLQTEEKDVLDSIDKIANSLKQTSEQTCQKDLHELHIVSSKIGTYETEVKDMRLSIREKMKAREKCGLFVELTKVKHSLSRLREEEMVLNYEINDNEFKTNTDKINLKCSNNTVHFGSFHGRSDVQRTVKLLYEIKLEHEADEKNIHITGLCTHSSFVIITDNENKSIKLINTEEGKVSSIVKLESDPFDVTYVHADKVATTLPQSEKIQYLCITSSGELSMGDSICVWKPCYGIEYLKPYIIVACHNPGSVHIMSASGRTLSTFKGFTEPMYVTISPNKELFYVSDIDRTYNVVIKVAFSGKEQKRLIYPDRRLVGLSVDNFGSVYTVSHANTTWPFVNRSEQFLVQLSGNLETIQKYSLLVHERCSYQIISQFYCKRMNKLFVGTDQGTIFALKLS